MQRIAFFSFLFFEKNAYPGDLSTSGMPLTDFAIAHAVRATVPDSGTTVVLLPTIVQYTPDYEINGVDGSGWLVEDALPGAITQCVVRRFSEIDVKVIAGRELWESSALRELVNSTGCIFDYDSNGFRIRTPPDAADPNGNAGLENSFAFKCPEGLSKKRRRAAEASFSTALDASYIGTAGFAFSQCRSSGGGGGICMGTPVSKYEWVPGFGWRIFGAKSRSADAWRRFLLPSGGSFKRHFGGMHRLVRGRAAPDMFVEGDFILARTTSGYRGTVWAPMALLPDLPARCEDDALTLENPQAQNAVRLVDQAMTLSFAAAGVWPTPAAP